MDGLWQDLKTTLRTHLKQPGFTLLAIFILALGIGANTAIYTLVEAVTLRALPVTNPHDLYRFGDTNNCCVNNGLQGSFSLFSHPLYLHLVESAPEFDEVAGFQANNQSVSVRRAGAPGAAEPAGSAFVSGNYFSTLGVGMAAGRALTPDDDRPGAEPAVVMSYRMWEERYGLDPSIIGGAFTLNAQPVTVIGVAARGFFGETLRVDPPDFWMPFSAEPLLRGSSSLVANPGQHWLYAIGRLKLGVAPGPVQERLSIALRGFLGTLPDLPAEMRDSLPQQHIVLTPGGSGVSTLRLRYAGALQVLAVVSALILLIACANLANLLLAHMQPFQFALRSALGASRGRLVRQTLVGGMLLAVAGGAAGLLVAYVGTQAIVATAFRGAAFVPIDPRPSLTGLGFATLVSLVTGVLFSTVPALVMAGTDPIEALRGAGRSTADRSAISRQGLVVAQVAVSLVLLVGAGLLTESLRRMEGQDFGFDTTGRFMVKVNPSLAGYTPERLGPLYTEIRSRLRTVPGVTNVSLSQYSPMSGDNWSGSVSVEGRAPEGGQRDSASWLRVGPDYFDTIGQRLVRGRAIDERDVPGAQRVVVVNETFAKRFFGDADPIGRHLGQGGPNRATDWEIVGIVADAKYVRAAEEAWPTYFLPLLQTVAYDSPGGSPGQTRSLYIRDILLHVSGRPASLESDVRRTLAGIDPDLTVLGMVSFDEQVGRNFNQQRLLARLTGLYGQLALLLAAVGLYGVTAHHVARRRGEIGIRMALGADRRQVLTMVIRRALVQTALGLAIGLPLALVAARGLSTQLYGITAHDPLVVNGAVLALAVSAVVAALVPARRAAATDPMRALKAD